MNNFTKRYVSLQMKLLALTLFQFTFLNSQTMASADGSPVPYTPHDNIALDCGSTDNNTDLAGRIWIADTTIRLDQSVISSSLSSQGDSIPYRTARLSRSPFTYSFTVIPGPKFIRLYFYSTSYLEFSPSNALFDVRIGRYTLLRNFSPALTADYLKSEAFSKEFCVNIDDQNLTISFTPSPNSYAFVSGIEIVSMPSDLYYSADDNTGFRFINQVNPYRILKRQALETLYRVNVGGSSISPAQDTGMYRSWSEDGEYLTNGEPSVLPVNLSINPSFSVIPNYSAPIPVYRTARTMGTNKTVNENYRLTWEFQVDSGFTYFVRLHFCEFQVEITKPGDRVFQIYIDNIVAESQADVISWAGGRGVPVYRDYAVMIGRSGKEKKRNLSIALHPDPAWRTLYSDAILNGVEIFKLGNDGNLAAPNPDKIPITPPNNSVLLKARPKNDSIPIFPIAFGVSLGFVAVAVLVCFLIFHAKSGDGGSGRSEGSSSWYQFFVKDYTSMDGSGEAYGNVKKISGPENRKWDLV
ncbi:hypothetical protein PTKIN_Ptkin15bG0177100 [Pterospermum kingtungense]